MGKGEGRGPPWVVGLVFFFLTTTIVGLVMNGRCWTAQRQRRHGLQDSDASIFCNQASESMDHILLGCVYSREVWAASLRWLCLDNLVQVAEANAMTATRKLLPKSLRRGFDSFFMLIGWFLWKERNARTFERVASSVQPVLCKLADEAKLWILAGNKHLAVLEDRRATVATQMPHM